MVSVPNTFATQTGNVPAAQLDANFAALVAAINATIVFPTGTLLPYAGSVASPPAGFLACDGSAVSRSTYAALYAVLGTSYGAGDGLLTFNLPDMRSRVPLGAGAGTVVESVVAANVDTTAETFLVTANSAKWITGMPVVVTSSGTLPTTSPAGGFTGTVYVIRSDSTHIAFGSSLANAVAGTKINMTTQGTGTHTVTCTWTTRVLGEVGGEEIHANVAGELPVVAYTDSGHVHIEQMATIADPRNIQNAKRGNGNNSGTYDVLSATTVSTLGQPGIDLTTASATATITNAGGSNAHNTMPPFVTCNYIIKT